MTRPSSNAVRPAPVFARHRWISPRQEEMLQSLWNSRLRSKGRRPRAERCRLEQFQYIAETVGREVASLRELTWREANRVLRRLLEEVRSPNLLTAAAGDSDAASCSDVSPASGGRVVKRPSKPVASSASSKKTRRPAMKAGERRKKQS